MVMLDGSGRPRAILEPSNSSDAHRPYFTCKGQFAEDMLLYCERFRLVELIDEAV
jgi:hypothetical protein